VAAFFKTSVTWVVDFRHDGHPRRWFRIARVGCDLPREVQAQLRDLYGDRAQLVAVRPATADEEAQYLRGEAPANVLCPTGRRGGPAG